MGSNLLRAVAFVTSHRYLAAAAYLDPGEGPMLLRPALPGVKPTLCTRWRGVVSAAPAEGASGGSRCTQSEQCAEQQCRARRP
jgi:hypothetical protein